MLHLAIMRPLGKFLCVIYLLVGSQKIVFRDIPSVSDDRFPIMRKMMNTNALPTNDPMKVLGDITISSPMKDVVRQSFTLATVFCSQLQLFVTAIGFNYILLLQA